MCQWEQVKSDHKTMTSWTSEGKKNIIRLKTLKGLSRVEEMVAAQLVAQLVAHMEIQFQTQYAV